MKITGSTLALVGALALVPTLALAQAKPATTTPAKPAMATPTKSAPATAVKPAATHSTSGILKSSDATSIVIAKTAKDTKTTTYAIDATTVTKGTLTPGARVQIRYHQDGARNVATAITVAPAKSLPKSGK
jgi:hypothetical protein